MILQHLLLGINAHINLDLGVTAADAGGTGPLAAVQADFDAVNDVLGSLVDGCQGALDEVSPWLDLVDRIGGRHDEAVIRFSLVAARQQAWRVAEQLHGLHGAERLAAIDAVDGAAAKVGHAVQHPGLAASALLLAVRARERAAPRRVIDVLGRGQGDGLSQSRPCGSAMRCRAAGQPRSGQRRVGRRRQPAMPRRRLVGEVPLPAPAGVAPGRRATGVAPAPARWRAVQ